MKRDDLVRLILATGCVLLRHGGRHDIFTNPRTGQKQPIPRHREIDDALAKCFSTAIAGKHILKYLGLK